MNGVRAVIKEAPKDPQPLPPSEDSKRSDVSSLQPGRGPSPKALEHAGTFLDWHDLGLPASKIVSSKFLSFKATQSI